jgi:SAM-dependent methyltransferase
VTAPSPAVTRCTLCKRDALAWNEPSGLRCASCGERFEERSGVLCFMRSFDDYTENYDAICKDDLAAPKTPGVVKQIFTGLVRERARGRVCDVGCGDGFVITRTAGTDRIAADIAFAYLERLTDDITRLWCRAEELPLRSGSVDTVVCTDLLEHVRDARALAAELDRILGSDGRILLAFPFEQDLGVYELPQYKRKYGKYKYVHLRSVGDALIAELFPRYQARFSHLITEGMELMEFKPYPIKFLELVRA